MTPERREELIAFARKKHACSGALEWIDSHPEAGLADLRPAWATWVLYCVPDLAPDERATLIEAVAREPWRAAEALRYAPRLTADERATLIDAVARESYWAARVLRNVPDLAPAERALRAPPPPPPPPPRARPRPGPRGAAS
ncbi:MAG: hypothetical protein IPM64_17325 [Phycisphaerales bacterium]|nr:hypothetical protein [Phycisphaerales bacterium]